MGSDGDGDEGGGAGGERTNNRTSNSISSTTSSDAEESSQDGGDSSDEDEEVVTDDDGGANQSNAGGESEDGEKLAAAALCVGVGSFSDPRNVQGLAHFLEHMIFMGSKKFPQENEYDSYISVGYCVTRARARCYYRIHMCARLVLSP